MSQLQEDRDPAVCERFSMGFANEFLRYKAIQTDTGSPGETSKKDGVSLSELVLPTSLVPCFVVQYFDPIRSFSSSNGFADAGPHCLHSDQGGAHTAQTSL